MPRSRREGGTASPNRAVMIVQVYCERLLVYLLGFRGASTAEVIMRPLQTTSVLKFHQLSRFNQASWIGSLHSFALLLIIGQCMGNRQLC